MARKPAISFIFITLVLDILGIGLIVPILPTLVQDLQGAGEVAAASTYGWLLAIYAAMQFLFSPLLGSLSDRFGRRPVILTALLGSGLDYFLLAFAPNLIWFFIARVISGITGANITAATAYIADVSPPEKRSANFGIVGAAFGIGFIIGPALGGILGELDVRLPFFVAGGLTLLNWLYGFIILPESLPKEKRRSFSWIRSNPLGAFFDLFRYPIVLGLAGVYFLIGVAHQVFPSTWALYTAHRFDWSASDIGLSLALVGLMAAIVQGGLTRVLIPRMGERRAAIGGLSLSVASFILYGLATQGWMVLVIIGCGSIAGIAGPAIQGIVSNQVGDHEQGGIHGALASLTSLAGIVGPLAATGLFSYFISPGAPIYLPGAAFFFGAFLIALSTILTVWCLRSLPPPTKAQAKNSHDATATNPLE